MLNFSDETVAKAANAIDALRDGTEVYLSVEDAAKAALQSLTLADLMQVDEVRELVGAGHEINSAWAMASHDADALIFNMNMAMPKIGKALSRFTGAK